MPIDVNKYIEKNKKPKVFRLAKIYRKKFKKILLKTKPFFIFLLKLALWIVLLGAILLFTNYSEEEIPFGLVIGGYLFIITNYYSAKQNYKDWQELGKDNEFYKRFCKQWRPGIFGCLFLFTIAIAYFNTFEFIVAVIFSYCMELSDRRFITSDIKNDLIMEKLNKTIN